MISVAARGEPMSDWSGADEFVPPTVRYLDIQFLENFRCLRKPWAEHDELSFDDFGVCAHSGVP
jgi:hypothetical protein